MKWARVKRKTRNGSKDQMINREAINQRKKTKESNKV